LTLLIKKKKMNKKALEKEVNWVIEDEARKEIEIPPERKVEEDIKEKQDNKIRCTNENINMKDRRQIFVDDNKKKLSMF